MSDDFSTSVKDVGGHVDAAEVGVDGDAGEVGVVLQLDPGVPNAEPPVRVAAVVGREISLVLGHVLVVVVLVDHVDLLGVEVVEAAVVGVHLQLVPQLFVVLMVQG